MSNQLVLKNLRRIWDQKRKKRGITQITAAKELGWTQGALSQYLNNLTELSTPAIIKLANYLEVPAQAIDPSLSNEMPKWTSIKVRHKNMQTSKVRETHTWIDSSVGDPNFFCIKIDNDIPIADNDRLLYKNTRVLCQETKIQQQKNQPDNPVTTYSVLYQKKQSQKKFNIERVPYNEWKTINTADFEQHYTIVALYLI